MATQATQAKLGELLVATLNNKAVGAVVYIPPSKITGFYPAGGAAIRMLVVDPQYRGLNIGKSLTEKCLDYAIRDSAPFISLHTSPIMEIALSMYLRMGFIFKQEVSPICGAPYNIYIKHLEV